MATTEAQASAVQSSEENVDGSNNETSQAPSAQSMPTDEANGQGEAPSASEDDPNAVQQMLAMLAERQKEEKQALTKDAVKLTPPPIAPAVGNVRSFDSAPIQAPLPQQQASNDSETSGPSKCLWISGLAQNTRAADLKALFSSAGRVNTAKIISSVNPSKEQKQLYGFVLMGSPEEAQAVVEKYGMCVIAEAHVKVELAPSNSLTDVVSNMNIINSSAVPLAEAQATAAAGASAGVSSTKSDEIRRPSSSHRRTREREKHSSSRDRKETRPAAAGINRRPVKGAAVASRRGRGAPAGRGAASAPTTAAHRHARGAVARAMARARGAATTRAAISRGGPPRGAPRSTVTRRAVRPATPPRRRTHGGTPPRRLSSAQSRPVHASNAYSRTASSRGGRHSAVSSRRHDDNYQRQIDRQVYEERLQIEREKQRLRLERERLEKERLELENARLRAMGGVAPMPAYSSRPPAADSPPGAHHRRAARRRDSATPPRRHKSTHRETSHSSTHSRDRTSSIRREHAAPPPTKRSRAHHEQPTHYERSSRHESSARTANRDSSHRHTLHDPYGPVGTRRDPTGARRRTPPASSYMPSTRGRRSDPSARRATDTYTTAQQSRGAPTTARSRQGDPYTAPRRSEYGVTISRSSDYRQGSTRDDYAGNDRLRQMMATVVTSRNAASSSRQVPLMTASTPYAQRPSQSTALPSNYRGAMPSSSSSYNPHLWADQAGGIGLLNTLPSMQGQERFNTYGRVPRR